MYTDDGSGIVTPFQHPAPANPVSQHGLGERQLHARVDPNTLVPVVERNGLDLVTLPESQLDQLGQEDLPRR